MIIENQAGVTDAVIEAFSRTEDPRLREILLALVRHLHGFSLIGSSCLEVGVLEPLDPQDGAPAPSSPLNQHGERLNSTQPPAAPRSPAVAGSFFGP